MTNETYENTYRVKIIYKYEIDGQKLESERIYFGDTIYISDKSKINKLVKKFPISKKVKVFVNPFDNNETVLIKGVRFSNLLNLFIGLTLFLFGLYMYQNQEIFNNLLK